MKLWWVQVKEWVWARWTAPERIKVLSQAYFSQGEDLRRTRERLAGTEDALRRLGDSIVAAEEDEQAALRAMLVPGMTPAQRERLAWLMEECGEVVEAAAKVLRHGYGSVSPFGGANNRGILEREVGHLLAALDILKNGDDLRRQELHTWREKKRRLAKEWMQHQPASVWDAPRSMERRGR